LLTISRYRQIIHRFEEIVRANLDQRRSIPDICAELAVGQRTLMRAVRAVYGSTPSRHLRALALAQAHAILRDPARPSVRKVALRCGFNQPGRFAADYRAAFGESPSETLRRTSAAALADG